MEMLNKGDKAVEKFPLSFSFSKDNIEILNKGVVVGEMTDEEFQEMVSSLAVIMLKRADKQTIVFSGKKSMLMVSLVKE